jgi:DNA-binding NtrC family response regulator
VRGKATERKRLLIVDDEAMILSTLARALKRHYDVTTLSSPEEALEHLASGESWDVVLSDVMMPEMNGVEFASRAVAARPELAGHIALMTGGVASPRARAALHGCALPVIEKPFDPAALRELLAKLASDGA